MSKSQYVDFKAVKTAVTMEQVLQHYGLLDKMKRSGDSLSGCCPLHGGSNPTQFRVSISKNCWNCFSDCKQGGNVLDFIAKKEDVSIHAAASKLCEWFNIPRTENLRQHTDSRSQVLVMLDEDEAGRAGREDIVQRLAPWLFVKAHVFEQAGQQPENLSAEQIAAVFH